MTIARLVSRSVMIDGETGSGKEAIAHILHLKSGLTGGFYALNCAALPEELAESELFGHEKGAFTGAHQERKGLIELAESGTLFLDEVGDLPMSIQLKLLRFLQDGTKRRLGSSQETRSRVRVVAATNRDLEAMVKAGTFRQDLLYRLSPLRVSLPPLRARGYDVVLIARYYLETDPILASRNLKLSRAASRLLCLHPWPGNVRQLQAALLEASLQTRGQRLDARHVAKALDWRAEPPAEGPGLLLAMLKQGGDYDARGLQLACGLAQTTFRRYVRVLLAERQIERQSEGRFAMYRLRTAVQDEARRVLELEEAGQASPMSVTKAEPPAPAAESTENDVPSTTCERLEAALDLIRAAGVAYRHQVARGLGTSERTASRLLKALVESGRVESLGSGRNQRYRLAGTGEELPARATAGQSLV